MKYVLVIAPHHDDESLGCGGTIAQTQTHVSVAVVLDGISGIPNAKSPEEATETRKHETIKAGKILGVNEHHFLDFPDRGFSYSREALQEIIRLIRKCRPTSLWFPHENDGDVEHQVIHALVKEAAWMAASQCLPEIGDPCPAITQLLCYEVWTPIQHAQMTVDISSVIQQKQAALACYESQISQASYDEAIIGLNRYRGGMSTQSKYVEAFQVLRTPFELPG